MANTKQSIVGKGVMNSNSADVRLKSVSNGITSSFLDVSIFPAIAKITTVF